MTKGDRKSDRWSNNGCKDLREGRGENKAILYAGQTRLKDTA